MHFVFCLSNLVFNSLYGQRITALILEDVETYNRVVNYLLARILTSYSSWHGPFYPKGIENSKWLRYYSKVLNYVGIDSSFYRVPNEFMVKNWYNRTPENFRFSAKLCTLLLLLVIRLFPHAVYFVLPLTLILSN
jgi:hypothetical protein